MAQLVLMTPEEITAMGRKYNEEKLSDYIKAVVDSGGDLTDVGNGVGIIIGSLIKPDIGSQVGFEKDDFLNGLNHGISLIDGTH